MKNKILLIFFLCCLAMLSVINDATAQDSDVPAPMLEDIVPAPIDVEERSAEDIFDSATEAQIAEAQDFYDFCKNDLLYSVQKDCKCASTRYLKTRMKLGDEITREEILKIHENTCPKGSAEDVPKKIKAEDIPEEYVKEAQAVMQKCEANLLMAREYDCECYAAKFLGKRIEAGPIKTTRSIELSMRGECPNIVGKIGYEYTGCMSSFMLSGAPPEIDAQDYCECYAREWAKNFQNFNGRLSNSIRGSIKVSSRLACMQPGRYE